jgi:hypothetical protein
VIRQAGVSASPAQTHPRHLRHRPVVAAAFAALRGHSAQAEATFSAPHFLLCGIVGEVEDLHLVDAGEAGVVGERADDALWLVSRHAGRRPKRALDAAIFFARAVVVIGGEESAIGSHEGARVTEVAIEAVIADDDLGLPGFAFVGADACSHAGGLATIAVGDAEAAIRQQRGGGRIAANVARDGADVLPGLAEILAAPELDVGAGFAHADGGEQGAALRAHGARHDGKTARLRLIADVGHELPRHAAIGGAGAEHTTFLAVVLFAATAEHQAIARPEHDQIGACADAVHALDGEAERPAPRFAAIRARVKPRRSGMKPAKAEAQHKIRRGEVQRLGQRRWLRLGFAIGERLVLLRLPCLATIEAAGLDFIARLGAVDAMIGRRRFIPGRGEAHDHLIAPLPQSMIRRPAAVASRFFVNDHILPRCRTNGRSRSCGQAGFEDFEFRIGPSERAGGDEGECEVGFVHGHESRFEWHSNRLDRFGFD